ncbi:hypothetical protein NQD34_018400 [Periophthalmus magnuspinnatus]|nr:hypothetical protein NQD34_018400 [Periophthalmus magnuspinnatus]
MFQLKHNSDLHSSSGDSGFKPIPCSPLSSSAASSSSLEQQQTHKHWQKDRSCEQAPETQSHMSLCAPSPIRTTATGAKEEQRRSKGGAPSPIRTTAAGAKEEQRRSTKPHQNYCCWSKGGAQEEHRGV